ncbi:CD209 antigen-like protein E isoform X2 [Archocentrus centrarchus]|uniref:CD209 antigen-like protein E isoform X2 n=1 Tax=Archocentrus centrarchus TaxID=63155 RepID=UPI0011EA4862|nr:CD209 antigen-like protein E isoform X2 [Archocentrus centrarchus]
MESSPRRHDEDGKREMPTVAGSSQTCHLTVRVVFAIAAITLITGLLFSFILFDSRCSLCPDNWLWWMGHCYFFSVGLQENRQWNESSEFCQQHNSSLVVIKDSAEMDFIQGVMTKFSQIPFLWMGLTDAEREGQWLWGDGTDIQHYMPVMVEWDSDHRDCADLRGGGSLFAADCEEYGPWACKKEYRHTF